MRGHAPLVQCLTNVVVAQWTANVLLAVGASPSMVDNPEEAGPFAAVADGVLVNLGTPQEATVAAMHGAVSAAAAAGTPWVLDPVGVGGLAWRSRVVVDLLAHASPALVRGNPSEILAFAGGGSCGRGPESVDAAEDALDAGRAGRVHGGDRLTWVPGADVDDPEWRVRVHGAAAPDLARWCGQQGLRLHVCAWSPEAERVGLARDALYLVRPDGYVALADGQASVSTLAAFQAQHGLTWGADD